MEIVIKNGCGKENELTIKAAAIQIIVSCMASTSVISSGIGLGFPAITTQLLTRDDGNVVMSLSEISWFASLTAITCPFGSLLSGLLTDKIGRRNTLMFLNIIAISSWLIIGFSSRDDAKRCFIELLIGRALIGTAIGMATTPTAMYSSEVAHANIRGRTAISTSFFISFGSLIAYFLGYLIPNDFRFVSFISAAITLGTLFILCFIPESPVYLISKNKIDEARNVLAMLRDVDKNDLTIDDTIKKVMQSQFVTLEKQSIFAQWKEFSKPQLYRPFLIMVSFFAFQQFSGIFAILVYGAQFSIEAGVAIDDAFLCTVIIGLIRCLTTILVGFGSDKFGRKPMTISSGIGMFLSLSGIILCNSFSNNEGSWSCLPTLFVFGFIFAGTFGFLSLPFAMVAEMYPQKSRGFATGITICIAYIMSFIHIKMFLSSFQYFGNVVVFSFYGLVTFAGTLFAIFVLPETKGKTLHEIEKYFQRK